MRRSGRKVAPVDLAAPRKDEVTLGMGGFPGKKSTPYKYLIVWVVRGKKKPSLISCKLFRRHDVTLSYDHREFTECDDHPSIL